MDMIVVLTKRVYPSKEDFNGDFHNFMLMAFDFLCQVATQRVEKLPKGCYTFDDE